MAVTRIARRNPAIARATNRTKIPDMRASARRSRFTAPGPPTRARCSPQKNVSLVLGFRLCTHGHQTCLHPSMKVLQSQEPCQVPEPRYPRPPWSVSHEPQGGLLPLVQATHRPLYHRDHHHNLFSLLFLFRGRGAPCRLVPPSQGGRSTSEKLQGGEPAVRRGPIENCRRSQSQRQIWTARLVVIVLNCSY